MHKCKMCEHFTTAACSYPLLMAIRHSLFGIRFLCSRCGISKFLNFSLFGIPGESQVRSIHSAPGRSSSWVVLRGVLFGNGSKTDDGICQDPAEAGSGILYTGHPRVDHSSPHV